MTAVWKYPVLFAGAGVLWKLVMLAVNGPASDNPADVFVIILLLLLGIFFTVRKTRKADNESRTFRSALKSGMVFTLFYSGFLLIYYLYIDPAYFQAILAERMREAAAQGANRNDLIEFYKNGKLYFLNPVSHAMFSFFGLMFLTFIYAAVISFLFRRKPLN